MSDHKCTLLIVDDEPYILSTLSSLLPSDLNVLTASSAEEAQGLFEHHPVNILMTDQRMPGKTGAELLEWARDHYPNVVRILMTGNGGLDDAIEAINRGRVYAYLKKPWKAEDVFQVLRNAQEKLRLEQERDDLISELQQLNGHLEERIQLRTKELQQTNQQLHEKMKELERLARTDVLTGLPNRRAITEIAERELKRLSRYRGAMAIGIVDVDHFKRVNSDFLLTGGDAVLRELADILRQSVRNTDAVGRLGGEEFMVVAPEVNLLGAERLSERIRTRVEDSVIDFKGKPINITVSTGFAVTTSTNKDVDFDCLHHLASEALQEAKDAGRNRTVLRSTTLPTAEQAG